MYKVYPYIVLRGAPAYNTHRVIHRIVHPFLHILCQIVIQIGQELDKVLILHTGIDGWRVKRLAQSTVNQTGHTVGGQNGIVGVLTAAAKISVFRLCDLT